jgi:hypothetical protein
VRSQSPSYVRRMSDPGSPIELTLFARRCRALVDGYIFRSETPALLVAGGTEIEGSLIVDWHLEGQPPASEEVLAKLVPAWIADSGGSQVGVAFPFGQPRLGVSLVVADEFDSMIEQAYLDVERMRLRAWRPVGAELPILDWQKLLAANAGWRELAKWRCRRCQSVCGGEADEMPTPCEFCESSDIQRVPLETPLSGPEPPYEGSSSFLAELLALIDVSSR